MIILTSFTTAICFSLNCVLKLKRDNKLFFSPPHSKSQSFQQRHTRKMTLTGSQLLSWNGGQTMCEEMVDRVLLFLTQVNNSQVLPDRDQVCPGWRVWPCLQTRHTHANTHTRQDTNKRTFCKAGTRRNATAYLHKRLGVVEFEDAVRLHTPAAAVILSLLHIVIALRRKEKQSSAFRKRHQLRRWCSMHLSPEWQHQWLTLPQFVWHDGNVQVILNRPVANSTSFEQTQSWQGTTGTDEPG